MRRLTGLAVCANAFAACPAAAQTYSDAAAIPPPPNLMEPVLVLMLFVVIFVAAAWSLAMFMQSPLRSARKGAPPQVDRGPTAGRGVR